MACFECGRMAIFVSVFARQAWLLPQTTQLFSLNCSQKYCHSVLSGYRLTRNHSKVHITSNCRKVGSPPQQSYSLTDACSNVAVS